MPGLSLDAGSQLSDSTAKLFGTRKSHDVNSTPVSIDTSVFAIGMVSCIWHVILH